MARTRAVLVNLKLFRNRQKILKWYLVKCGYLNQRKFFFKIQKLILYYDLLYVAASRPKQTQMVRSLLKIKNLNGRRRKQLTPAEYLPSAKQLPMAGRRHRKTMVSKATFCANRETNKTKLH